MVSTDDCWLFAGHLSGGGYGYITYRLTATGKKVSKRAHRVVYEVLVGEIPEGLDLDHLCRVIQCVNPDHLEPVTKRENGYRSFSPPAINRRKTHCYKGHAFSESNTRIRRGWRECLTCEREYQKRYYHLHKRKVRPS